MNLPSLHLLQRAAKDIVDDVHGGGHGAPRLVDEDAQRVFASEDDATARDGAYLVRPSAAHAPQFADPACNLYLFIIEGGLEILYLVAALKREPPLLTRALDRMARVAQGVEVRLLYPVKIDGVIDVL